MEYVTLSEIEARLDWVLASPAERGCVEALVVRPNVNLRESLDRVMFSPQQGVTGDNWLTSCWKKLPSGESDPQVQVAIMNARMIEVLTQDKSRWPLAGDQLFVDFDLSVNNLAVGDRLQVGAAVLEITAEPHRACSKFKKRFGPDASAFVNSPQGDAHRLRGVYARIVSAGEVCVGNSINKVSSNNQMKDDKTVISESEAAPIQAVQQWLEQVVIGLNLCPFASRPYQEKRVRIQVCDADSELALLETLQAELTLIDEKPASEIETTLLVIPNMLHDFDDYNQFLDLVDALLDEFEWGGEYQIASFHPQYCFAGVAPESPENLTNRSPYPLLHIIREASIEAALEHYENPEGIPERNIEKMKSLSDDEKRRLFGYLF